MAAMSDVIRNLRELADEADRAALREPYRIAILARVAADELAGSELAFSELVINLHEARRERDQAIGNQRETIRLYAQWRSRAEKAEAAVAPPPASPPEKS